MNLPQGSAREEGASQPSREDAMGLTRAKRLEKQNCGS